MEQEIFIFVGTLAAITTGAMWTTLIDPRLLVAPAVMWIIWGFGATNVTHTSMCCVESQTYTSLMILGFVLAGICIVFWIGSILGRTPTSN